jgi:hypothetical protein
VFVRVRGEIEIREISEESRRNDAVVGGQEHLVLEDALGLRFIKALVILLKNTINSFAIHTVSRCELSALR